MKQTVAVINGPNINMLGSREISVYGEERWADIEKSVSAYADRLNLEVIFYQSNHEGAIVDFIQQNAELLAGIIINPAAFTKTGFSVLDALTARRTPYIEVHLTNLMQRGGWHSESIFYGTCNWIHHGVSRFRLSNGNSGNEWLFRRNNA